MIDNLELLNELEKMVAGEEMKMNYNNGEGGYNIIKGDFHSKKTNNGFQGEFFIEGDGCCVSTEDWLESAEEAADWLEDTLKDCNW